MPTKSTRKPERRKARADTALLARITVQYASRAAKLPSSRRFAVWARAAAGQAETITIRLVTSREARELNRAYRGKDYATNVLTFTYDAGRSGDIVICPLIVAREAVERGRSLEAHYAHLTVHGVLHLRGLDHETPQEAARMERIEIAILRRFGIANPYLS